MDMNIIKSLIAGTLFGFGLLVSSHANAVSVSLDINNVYGDVIGAVDVMIETGLAFDIDENDHSNDIKFTVDPDATLFTAANSNKDIGISSFGFNTDDGLFSGVIDFFGTASGWNTSQDQGQDGWGSFDVVVKSNGGTTWQDPLIFWVTGVTGDTPDSYNNRTTDNEGYDRYFAAHVMNIDTGVMAWRDPNDQSGDDCVPVANPDPNCEFLPLTSAFFTTPVPVPAAVWLFGSGLLGLAGIARRRKA